MTVIMRFRRHDRIAWRKEYKVEGEPGYNFPHYLHIFHVKSEADKFMHQRRDALWAQGPTLQVRTVFTTDWEDCA